MKYLDGHPHISKYAPHVERTLEFLWVFLLTAAAQTQISPGPWRRQAWGWGDKQGTSMAKGQPHRYHFMPLPTLGQSSEMEKPAGACGAGGQSIPPVRVCVCSHLIHNHHRLSHLSHHSGGTGQPPACPTPPSTRWACRQPCLGEEGGSREASWEEGVSCGFREDLYSLLIDFFAYSPTGLHCSFSALPWAWGWVFKDAQWPKSCVLTQQNTASPGSALLPKMQAQPWAHPRGTSGVLIHYTSVSRRNPSLSCHS